MPNALPHTTVTQLLDRWWHRCSHVVCNLPQEHSQEWLELISQVIRYYRSYQNCQQKSQKRFFRSLCLQALSKARWEFMLLSVYGHLPAKQIKSLQELQDVLEGSLQ